MISRQKLIEELMECSMVGIGKRNPKGSKEEMLYEDYIKLDTVLELIESQPPADRWIPCSERLPKKPKEWVDSYIIQQRYVYTPFSAYWDGKKWTDEYAEELNHVLAWMPLPEPYKGAE